MSERKVALVTGANRGIGYEICRQLLLKNYEVILSSRNSEKGEEAVQAIRQEMPQKSEQIHFKSLDVNDLSSIKSIRDWVEQHFNRLDVLINNAGIFLDKNGKALDGDLATVRQTLETNLYAPWQLCLQFIPMMQAQNYGRIINLASGLGAMEDMAGHYPAYRLSKVGLNALTQMLAAELNSKTILINSMCPGWVRTEMGGANASRSLPEGADTAVWLAEQPNGSATGKFFRDRQVINW